MNTTKVKPKLIARIYIEPNERWSSNFATIGVNFNFIDANSNQEHPKFIDTWDVPKGKLHFDKIMVKAFFDDKSYQEQGRNAPYGYKLKSIDQLELSDAIEFVKAGKKILRSFDKIVNIKGYNDNMSGYLEVLFDSMKVDAVIFEQLSENKQLSKWTEYQFKDIPTLIGKACEIGAFQKNWNTAKSA